jgi:putative membrane protein
MLQHARAQEAHMTLLKKFAPIVLVGAAALSACSRGDAQTSSAQPAAASVGDEATPQEPSSSRTTQLTDNQILGILATVDAGEIEQARMAIARGSDARVKAFANHMVDQHEASSQQISGLATQSSLMPAQSRVSITLQSNAEKTLDALKQTSAGDFDSAYISYQIQQHQEVLDMLQAKLMPASRSDAVSAQLKTAHTMVQKHLNDARQIAPLLDAADHTDPSQPPHTMPIPQP